MTNNLYFINSLLIDRFTSSLLDEGFSKATVKNYLTDVNQFLSWRQKQVLIDDEELFESYVVEISKRFSKASVKRKLSAIKKYLAFEKSEMSRTKIISDDTTLQKRLLKLNYLPPLAMGALLILALPIATYYMQSQISSFNKTPLSISIPDSTIISTSDGKAYSFKNSQGVRICLSEDSSENIKEGSIENPAIFTKSFNNEDLADLSFQGTATIYEGTTQAIISSSFITTSSFIELT